MTKVYLLLKILIGWFLKDNPQSEDHARCRYSVADKIKSELEEERNHQIFNHH